MDWNTIDTSLWLEPAMHSGLIRGTKFDENKDKKYIHIIRDYRHDSHGGKLLHCAMCHVGDDESPLFLCIVHLSSE